MAQNFEFRDNLSFAADKVLKKMIDPDFLLEWTKVQKGLNPKISITTQSDNQIVIDMDLEEPLPKPLGTIKAHMTFNWDLDAMRMTWIRKADGMAAKAEISGITELIPQGDDACVFVEKININIPIPIMGKKFEKLVGGYLKEGRPDKLAYLRSHID